MCSLSAEGAEIGYTSAEVGMIFVPQEWRMARNSTGRQQEAQWKLMLQDSPVRTAA